MFLASQEVQESRDSNSSSLPPQTTIVPPDRRDWLWKVLCRGRGGMEQVSKGSSLFEGKVKLMSKRTSIRPDELYKVFSLPTPLLLPTNQLASFMSDAPDWGSLKVICSVPVKFLSLP